MITSNLVFSEWDEIFKDPLTTAAAIDRVVHHSIIIEFGIEIEEIVGLGKRCVMRWCYKWVDADGKPGHVRGVDIYRVQDGLIREKLSYVKG